MQKRTPSHHIASKRPLERSLPLFLETKRPCKSRPFSFSAPNTPHPREYRFDTFNFHRALVTSCRAADYGGAEVPVRVKGQRKCRRQAHNSQQTSTFRSECVSCCARLALFLQHHQQRGAHTWQPALCTKRDSGAKRPTRSLSTTNL